MIPPAVQAEIEFLEGGDINPSMRDLRRITALAVRVTALGCARIATEIDDKDGFRSGTGARIAALISARYEVTK